MEFREHIDDIRNRLKSNQYPSNEQAIRTGIVDRILLNLGWRMYVLPPEIRGTL